MSFRTSLFDGTKNLKFTGKAGVAKRRIGVSCFFSSGIILCIQTNNVNRGKVLCRFANLQILNYCVKDTFFKSNDEEDLFLRLRGQPIPEAD